MMLFGHLTACNLQYWIVGARLASARSCECPPPLAWCAHFWRIRCECVMWALRFSGCFVVKLGNKLVNTSLSTGHVCFRLHVTIMVTTCSLFFEMVASKEYYLFLPTSVVVHQLQWPTHFCFYFVICVSHIHLHHLDPSCPEVFFTSPTVLHIFLLAVTKHPT